MSQVICPRRSEKKKAWKKGPGSGASPVAFRQRVAAEASFSTGAFAYGQSKPREAAHSSALWAPQRIYLTKVSPRTVALLAE